MSEPWPPPDRPAAPPGFARLAPMPFPVNAPFRVRADLTRLDLAPVAKSEGTAAGGGQTRDPMPGLLISDREYPRFARVKLVHLDDPRRPLASVSPEFDPRRVLGALSAALRTLAAEQPDVIELQGRADGEREAQAEGAVPRAVRAAGEGQHFLLHRAGLGLSLGPDVVVSALHESAQPLAKRLERLAPAARALAALSLGVQEDLVLMGWPQLAGLPEEPGADRVAGAAQDPVAMRQDGLVALALSVVFPSGWEPLEKLGHPLWTIHAPVADGGPLRDASLNLSRAMVDKGPFERFVWTLSTDPGLARWPGTGAGQTEGSAGSAGFAGFAGSTDLADVFFRSERQVTVPLPEFGAALFLIRVQVAPLTNLCFDAERRDQLVASLRSMSDAVIAYKNLHRLRERVLAAWGHTTDA